MNESYPPTPGPMSNPAASAPGASAPPVFAPGTPPAPPSPEELAPISSLTAIVEAILRQPRRVMFGLRQPNQGKLIFGMLFITLAASLIYGLVVGTFSGGEQLWAAPAKIAAGLFISALICLPSLYIFSCLCGSQARLVEVFGLLTGLLTLMTILLIGFAPVAWVFSQSTKSLATMGALHIAFWFVAVIFGLRFLYCGFKTMHAGSRGGLNVWICIYLFVALQMTTALRPIVGVSHDFLPKSTDKKFFVAHWIDCIGAEMDPPPPNQTQLQPAR
jgi:hypothetical protein